MSTPDVGILVEAFTAALNAVADKPKDLIRRANNEALEEHNVTVGVEDLATLLGDPAGDLFLQRLFLRLGTWDAAEPAPEWAQNTEPRTAERRAAVYQLLGVAAIAHILDPLLPVNHKPVVVIDARRVRPWYPPAQLGAHEFYWPHYQEFLLTEKGWEGNAVSALDQATSRVVERIADPTEASRYASRGLVVGHVQSGKTANFTGCIAKAIDAGYRLVIILAGTLENLRRQTQRRLDQELIGVENIITTDPDEYAADEDWPHSWIRHLVRPSERGYPDIIRLTTHEEDYRELNQGIRTLELRKQDRAKPLWDPVNLYHSDAIVVVVKKQQDRLDALISDLRKVTKQLGEIPALVLDDESDQASINTVNPVRLEEGDPERTAINERITRLLGILPRGQYVGYTATPYANVLVNPDDAADLFPRDFILSLTPPTTYMGLKQFQRRPTAAGLTGDHPSNIVRFLTGVDDSDRRAELGDALDAFVLTAALKLYRVKHSGRRYRHHTMLVHETVRMDDHRALGDQLADLWNDAEFTTGRGLARLEKLWQTDFAPVSRADGADQANPASFDELRNLVGDAVEKITTGGQRPYIIVNGDPEIEREDVAFDQRDVWRVLIGGASLSRGFTVEGLTISYYRRRAGTGDTTMQMGRWFGYRPGYRDLVRLYIGIDEPAPNNTRVDLFENFQAILKDEEAFRGQLGVYAQLIEVPDGQGGFQKRFKTPRDVVPLVSQHLRSLPPVATAKRRYAQVIRTEFSQEPNRWPIDEDLIAANYTHLAPIAAAAQADTRFGDRNIRCYRGTVTHTDLMNAMEKLAWLDGDSRWTYELQHLQTHSARIADWLVLLPQLITTTNRRELPGIGPRSVHKRTRRDGRGGAFGFISGTADRTTAEQEKAQLYTEGEDAGHGVVLIYPVNDGGSVPRNDEALRRSVVLAPYFVLPPQVPTDETEFVYQARSARGSAISEPSDSR